MKTIQELDQQIKDLRNKIASASIKDDRFSKAVVGAYTIISQRLQTKRDQLAQQIGRRRAR